MKIIADIKASAIISQTKARCNLFSNNNFVFLDFFGIIFKPARDALLCFGMRRDRASSQSLPLGEGDGCASFRERIDREGIPKRLAIVIGQRGKVNC